MYPLLEVGGGIKYLGLPCQGVDLSMVTMT